MDLGELPKKKRSFYGQADRKGLPPLSRSAFGEFFLCLFDLGLWLSVTDVKRILTWKKSFSSNY